MQCAEPGVVCRIRIARLAHSFSWDQPASARPSSPAHWPSFYSNPVQLFHKVFGFYVGMEGDKIPTELQGWSVTQAKVSRDKRGLDSVTFASFWIALDEWMAIHKQEMLPQPNE